MAIQATATRHRQIEMSGLRQVEMSGLEESDGERVIGDDPAGTRRFEGEPVMVSGTDVLIIARFSAVPPASISALWATQ
jgi:hypothetical protein